MNEINDYLKSRLDAMDIVEVKPYVQGAWFVRRKGKRKFEVLRITMLLRKQDKVVLDGDREDEQG